MLLVLVVHLRPQHIQPRADTGIMRCGGLVQRHLRGRQLRIHSRNPRGVRDAHQVGVAHRQHHHVARVFSRKLGRGKVMFRRDVVL